MAVFGVAESSQWRLDADPVFGLLQVFAMSVQSFRRALEPAEDDVIFRDPMEANSEACRAHDEFYAALREWVNDHAPGGTNTGRKDPTRGGFAALSTSMQDAYRALTLAHLTTLGLSLYQERVEADGRTDEVLRAANPSVDWYNAASQFVASLVRTGEPRGAEFIAAYTEMVAKPFKSVSVMYDRLVPYVNSMGTPRSQG